MVKLRDAADFQQQKLKELMELPFGDLLRLPAKNQLQLPSTLQGLKAYVCAKPAQDNGVSVSVRVERRSMLIFALASEDGFDAFPDGKIAPFNSGASDEED